MLRCFEGILGKRRTAREPGPANDTKKAPEVAPHFGSFAKGGSDWTTFEQRGRESWLEVSSSGELNLHEVDLDRVSRRLGISVRDLSLVNAQEGYKLCPVKLVARGPCILACLEALRLVIRDEEAVLVSVPSPTSPQTPVYPFSDNPAVRDLVSRLRISAHTDGGAEYVDKSLPFKLVVLEWALSTAAKALSEEVLSFEQEALPLLDSLAKKVTHQKIVDLRHVKFRLADLLARADRLRHAIEVALEDLQPAPERRISRSRFESRTGYSRRHHRRRSSRRTLVTAASELPECVSLLESYGIQVEAAQSALRNVHSSAGSTEATLHLSMKLRRLRLGR